MRVKGRKLGAVTRLHAPESHLVGHIVQSNVTLFDRLFSTEVDGQPFVQEVQALIPMNPRFPSHCDCGETRKALVQAIQNYWWSNRVSILSSNRDDPFGNLPNYGMHQLDRKGCDWGLMIAAEASGCWTSELATEISYAADDGASIIGLGLPELEELTKVGIVSNRCAVWNIGRLIEAGGFFPISSPLIAPHVASVFTGCYDNKEYTYAPVGGEEGVTSILMAQLGARVAVITPRHDIPVEEPSSPNKLRQFQAMMATKAKRTWAAIEAVKLSSGVLTNALI
ncbi:MAG: hypothetical protein WA082_03520 [Candidatus Moraniibacteriota bacterium]